MYCIPKGNDNKEADMENKTVTENSTVSCAEEMNTAEVYGSDQYAADLKTREQRSADVGETALVK